MGRKKERMTVPVLGKTATEISEEIRQVQERKYRMAELADLLEKGKVKMDERVRVERPEIPAWRTPITASISTAGPDGGGVKHDQQKLRVDLLPVPELEGIAEVLTRGAVKYGDRNWEEGIAFGRLYGAALRHMFAFWQGEDDDAESGLPHLDHALCELLFLSRMAHTRFDLDDRPKGRKG